MKNEKLRMSCKMQSAFLKGFNSSLFILHYSLIFSPQGLFFALWKDPLKNRGGIKFSQGKQNYLLKNQQKYLKTGLKSKNWKKIPETLDKCQGGVIITV